MPLCPRCGYEYREGVRRCPDCNAALVATAEGEPEADAVPLLAVADQAEALVLRAALEEAGIPVLLRTHGPITGELTELADGLSDDYAILLVPSPRLAEAQELLDALRRQPAQWPPGMEPEEER